LRLERLNTQQKASKEAIKLLFPSFISILLLVLLLLLDRKAKTLTASVALFFPFSLCVFDEGRQQAGGSYGLWF